MSSVIKTTTPFISQELLCSALDALHVGYKIQGKDILTNLHDYYGLQKFVYSPSLGKYQYQHDSSANGIYSPYPWGMDVKNWGAVSNFLQRVDAEYNNALRRLEEEKRRLEEEKRLEEIRRLEEKIRREEELRKQYVESQKKAIIEKAKSKGYSVKETKQGNKIRLVLVRTQY